MTKGKVVLVPFPFDDLSATKVRRAVCLTEPIGLISMLFWRSSPAEHPLPYCIPTWYWMPTMRILRRQASGYPPHFSCIA